MQQQPPPQQQPPAQSGLEKTTPISFGNKRDNDVWVS